MLSLVSTSSALSKAQALLTSNNPIPDQTLSSVSNLSNSVIPAEVSVFFRGYGGCFSGLIIDSHDNLYPVNSLGVYKILPNGTLVNGINDANLFANNLQSDSAALDEKGGMFYSTGEIGFGGPSYVSSAQFSVGSGFTPLVYGLGGPGNVVIGQGPLGKALFVAESVQNKVARLSLSSLVLTEIGNSSIFRNPSSIASAADGTVYVSNLNVDRYGGNLGPMFITKIAPDGTLSRLLTASAPAPNLADTLAVDKEGNIYWGTAYGINKYDANGNFLGTLPGPPDRRNYTFLHGAAFDSKGDLFVADNDGCKEIIKYTFLPQPKVSLSVFFTDASSNILPADADGTFRLNVVIANSIVRGTNPGEIRAWVNVTNIGSVAIQSLSLTETLPANWAVHPRWLPGVGAIHLFLANTTNLTTNPEITQPSNITVSTGSPQVVNLTVQSFNDSAIGQPLLQGQSVLLSVKMSYALKDTSQSVTSYPRTYTDAASASAWTQASLTGVHGSGASSASLTASAKVPGDVNGDLKVNILDAALIAYSYGSRPGDSRWNNAADLNNDGVVDILDAAQVAFYYGTQA